MTGCNPRRDELMQPFYYDPFAEWREVKCMLGLSKKEKKTKRRLSSRPALTGRLAMIGSYPVDWLLSIAAGALQALHSKPQASLRLSLSAPFSATDHCSMLCSLCFVQFACSYFRQRATLGTFPGSPEFPSRCSRFADAWECWRIGGSTMICARP